MVKCNKKTVNLKVVQQVAREINFKNKFHALSQIGILRKNKKNVQKFMKLFKNYLLKNVIFL